MTATGHGAPPARATADGDRPTTTEADARPTTSVTRRAVSSSGAIPASGMKAWLASALSMASTAIAR
ncbi:hypothetical protein OG229_20750 [Streptomyces platensis]|uniref:hypothetical protein n=1 Tax=Streptomyces platensis TaxID=58346 RepID=UPI002E11E322|nr:hypothetical protein OG229_20750 [Streptomyces platensis]